jgi:hypothetical protein
MKERFIMTCVPVSCLTDEIVPKHYNELYGLSSNSGESEPIEALKIEDAMKKSTNPHNSPNPEKQKELDQDDLNIIYSYLNNLYYNYGINLKPGIVLHTLAIPYDKGVILEINYRSKGRIDYEVDKTIQQDVAQAFKKLNLDVHKVLTPEEEEQYTQALKSNELIFSGTGFLGTEDKLYIIKDYSKDQWSEQAAKKDINSILSSCYN